MEPVVVIPPIRTCLEDRQSMEGEPWKTAKEWYLYWQRSGEKLASLVTSGTHADRPADAPEGALYTETDRGDVLYQNVDGHWQYLAGTMWGTLSPDQRPTDLGPNDAGFEYRSVDPDPFYDGRQFLWSQSEWIETTPVRYGTHAQRLATDATTLWSGALWAETDRSNVLYQNQGGTWHYLAGTMWGTVTPDQRPTDLGVNDGGFHFHGTDDNREFLWSQTVWVEVTAVRYGTHSARPAPASVADGSVYVESDRGGVIYQAQAGVWKYLAGTMFGTLSPDQRPTDLGVNDGGFDFRGTDQQREFIWSQTAWVEAASQVGDVQLARATNGNFPVPASFQDIPGATLTLARAGTYWIHGIFDFSLQGPGGPGFTFLGALVADGAMQGANAVFSPADASGTFVGGASVGQQWIYSAPAAGKIVKLQCYKTGGSGPSNTGTNTSISAIWIKP